MSILVSTLVVTTVELLLILALFRLLYAAGSHVLKRAASGRSASVVESSRKLQFKLRNVLIVTVIVLSVAILAYNAWLSTRGIDGWQHVVAMVRGIDRNEWI